MPARSLLIVNPHSRGGAVGRRAPELEAKLRRAFGAIEVEATRARRDAERIAREAVRAGAERLIVAGGDGTTNEVVTGLLAAGLGECASVGLLPLGTGGDLIRTLGLPRTLDAAIEHMARDQPRRIDAGRLLYRTPGGDETSTFFLNVGSLGISALVTQMRDRAPRRLGGRAAYLLATARALARWRPVRIHLRLDGSLLYDAPVSFVAVANGRYFGGGMLVAPRAVVDDGLFEVVVVPAMSRTKLLCSLPSLYRGSHVEMPGVIRRPARRFEAVAEGEAWIEIDGEPRGRLPAVVDVMPNAVIIAGAGA